MNLEDKELFTRLKSLGISHRKNFKPIPQSTGSMRPGDLVMFTYDQLEDGILTLYTRLALVVYSSNGTISYTSQRGNLLVCCFRLNDCGDSVLKFILKRLYKRADLCSYETIQKGLGALGGEVNYRTYKLSGMTQLHKLTLTKKEMDKAFEDDESFDEFDLDEIE